LTFCGFPLSRSQHSLFRKSYAPSGEAEVSAFIPLKAIQVARLFYGGIILGLIQFFPVLYQFRAIVF
jgi:hypothetical protein